MLVGLGVKNSGWTSLWKRARGGRCLYREWGTGSKEGDYVGSDGIGTEFGGATTYKLPSTITRAQGSA